MDGKILLTELLWSVTRRVYKLHLLVRETSLSCLLVL
jgi:hypothetical protein